jgi:Protein of unknown function (DUF3618)
MSTEGEVTRGAAPHDDLQALTEEIERTRTQLGETVEELAAKADVKARAQEKAADAKQTIVEVGGRVKDQVTSGTARTAATIREKMPEPVQRAAKRAVGYARQRRGPLAMAVGAALLVGALIARRRRQ